MLHMNAVGSTPYPKKKKKKKWALLQTEIRRMYILGLSSRNKGFFFYGNKFMPKLGPSVFLLLHK